jgi:diguanylate cyclase (GGDEF)-like protein
MRKSKRHTVIASVISIAVCLIYLLWISPLSPFNLFSLKITDGFYRISSMLLSADKAAKEIVIVSIDDESMNKINERWPWPRSILAKMIERINADGPAVICLDFVFMGKSANEADDLTIAHAIKNAGNVVIGVYFGSTGRQTILNDTIAQSAKSIGFINKPRDIDNAVRRMEPIAHSASGNVIGYSLTAQTAAYVRGKPVQDIIADVPRMKDGTARIQYFGNIDRFVHIPIWEVLKGEVPPGVFRGKIVFVGTTSELLHDNHPTALGIMPGVVMAANETLTFLTGRYFSYAGPVLNFTILLIFVLTTVLVLLKLPLLRGIIASLFGVAAFLALGLGLFLKGFVIEPFGGVFLIVSALVVIYSRHYIVTVLENIKLGKEAVTDGLTGLYLYRYLELQIKRDMEKTAEENKPLSLLIYDVDHFKEINDKYGHEFGNTILRATSKVIKESVRSQDTVARYGGDEFCVLMPNATSNEAKRTAERALDNLKKKTSITSEIINITMSVGVVSTQDYVPVSPADFVKAADAALYRSKSMGRDRITIFDKTIDKPEEKLHIR